MTSIIVQIFIAIFGLTGIYLSQSKSAPARRFACIFGLMAQPFWFITTYMNEQWGIFILTFFYTYAWWTGFKNHWLSKERL